MKKKVTIILFEIFMVSLFCNQSFSQSEIDVIKRYDYSSPKASFESFKKALQTKDIEGVLIHYWQLSKDLKGTIEYGVGFKDSVKNFTKGESEDEILDRFDHLQSMSDGHFLDIRDLNFVRELSRNTGMCATGIEVNSCLIILEHKSDGRQAIGHTVNFKGTNEWWVDIDLYGG